MEHNLDLLKEYARTDRIGPLLEALKPQRTLPDHMYKFCRSDHASSLLKDGKLRIGTLKYYRKDDLPKGISDANEGFMLVSGYIDDTFDHPTDRNSRELMKLGFIQLNSSNSELCGIRFNNVLVSKQNCFMFCMSESCTREVQEQFQDKDACIEITNPAFFEIITDNINASIPVKFRGVYECDYSENIVEEWDSYWDPSHPAIVKHPRFIPQRELRALWYAVQDDEAMEDAILPEYIDIEDKRLIDCCESVDL